MSQVLTFDEASHSYRLDGELIPGVTSVLAPLSSYGDVPREILEAAARRGTHVHRAVELIAQGRLDWNTVDEDHYGYLEAFMTFCDRMKPEFIANEKRTFHPVLKYAGTLDMELVLHGKPKAKLAVLDVKSCVTVMPTTGPQTAAYLAAENAHRPVKREHIVERYGLRLGKDGTFDLIPYTAASDLHDFNACLRLYRFQQLHHKFYKQLAA